MRCGVADGGAASARDRAGRGEIKRRPLVGGSPDLLGVTCGLERLYVLSLQALGSLFHLELHRLTFLQAAEAVRLDRREMHENIFAALARDESKTLGVVKPLHCSLFHD